MEKIIEQLIADFYERNLPVITRRQARLPGLSGKIDSVIGMRRTGKTWFLFQTIADLLKSGTAKETMLYLNFEDERLLPITTENLRLIPEIYYRRYPRHRGAPCTFFFDEIQNIKGWENFARRLIDTENIHLCLTGSSAKLLSKEIATTLRGRSIATEIFPFSFEEASRHAGIVLEDNQRPGAKKRSFIENKLISYLLEGGFPETQGIRPEYRIRVLQEYLDAVILRDIVERHKISSTVPLRYLIRHLLNAAACPFSVNKFYNDLRSQGVPCSKNTLHEFLDHLCDAYLFFQVPLHTCSVRARMVNPRKIYTVDTGLIHACSHDLRPNMGRLLENFVYLELRRDNYNIEYYKTAGGGEVDFLVTNHKGEKKLIQVCADLNNSTTKQRELKALTEAMEEQAINKSVIVTLTQEDKLHTTAGTINVIPAWLWVVGRR